MATRLPTRSTRSLRLVGRLRPGIEAQQLLIKSLTTLVLAAGAVIIMIPLAFMISTSLKDRNQLRASPPPLIPCSPL